MVLAHTDALGNLPPDLAGPVKLELAWAEERIHDGVRIRVDLPSTTVPAGRVVLRFEQHVLRTGLHADLDTRGLA